MYMWPRYLTRLLSFSNHVLTPLITHPNLMYSASLDVNSTTHAERLPNRLLVLRIRDRERTAANQMGRETVVRMRGVVCVSGAHVCSAHWVQNYGTWWSIKERKRDKGREERGVRAIGPCEDAREAPRSDLVFGVFG